MRRRLPCATRGRRATKPCGRAGHSAHFYAGPLGGGGGDCAGAAGGGYGCLLVHAGADHSSRRLDDLWVLPLDVSWARPRDAPARPAQMGWRSLSTDLETARAFVPNAPPRAHHAAVLHGASLYVIGGEAPSSPSSSSLSAAADQLWQLHLPSLRWTAMHARGGAAPRPGAGAAALLSSLASPSPASAILLVGGQRSGGRGAMPLWAYRLGRAACAEEGEAAPGCYRGHRCDGASGECVCARTGGAPPCKPPPEPPRPVIEVRDGAWSLVTQAWFLVAVSVAGAQVGGYATRHFGASASRPYRF